MFYGFIEADLLEGRDKKEKTLTRDVIKFNLYIQKGLWPNN